MATINRFISKVKRDGFAKDNRFEVIITPPIGLNASTVENEKLLYYCQAATLPGINFLSQAVYTYGESREVIYNRNYEPVTLEFLVDTNMNIKWFFDRWTQLIIDPRTRMISYYRDYVSTVEIYQLDHSDQEDVKYAVRLHEAFPKTVNAISYNSGSKDLVKLTVQMEYKYWTTIQGPIISKQARDDVPDQGSVETPT